MADNFRYIRYKYIILYYITFGSISHRIADCGIIDPSACAVCIIKFVKIVVYPELDTLLYKNLTDQNINARIALIFVMEILYTI